MSNLSKLVGKGEEVLISDSGEILARFLDGNLSNKIVVIGSKEVTLSLVDDSCTCDDCFDTEHPCLGECGECQGCQDLAAERAEIDFESGYAQGRF